MIVTRGLGRGSQGQLALLGFGREPETIQGGHEQTSDPEPE